MPVYCVDVRLALVLCMITVVVGSRLRSANRNVGVQYLRSGIFSCLFAQHTFDYLVIDLKIMIRCEF